MEKSNSNFRKNNISNKKNEKNKLIRLRNQKQEIVKRLIIVYSQLSYVYLEKLIYDYLTEIMIINYILNNLDNSVNQ